MASDALVECDAADGEQLGSVESVVAEGVDARLFLSRWLRSTR